MGIPDRIFAAVCLLGVGVSWHARLQQFPAMETALTLCLCLLGAVVAIDAERQV